MSSLFRSPLTRGFRPPTRTFTQGPGRSRYSTFSPDMDAPGLEPSGTSPSLDEALPGENVNMGPHKPQTREELEMYLQSVKGGTSASGTPIEALEKTNFKYKNAKECKLTGEAPDAERTAVEGMFDLVRENQELVTTPSFDAHRRTQQLDRDYHRGVTAREDNPYGPATTLLTNIAPTDVRAAYSYATSHIPTFMSRDK